MGGTGAGGICGGCCSGRAVGIATTLIRHLVAAQRAILVAGAAVGAQ